LFLRSDVVLVIGVDRSLQRPDVGENSARHVDDRY